MSGISQLVDELSAVPRDRFGAAAAQALGVHHAWHTLLLSHLDSTDSELVVGRPSAIAQAYFEDLVLLSNGACEVFVRRFDRGVFDAFVRRGRIAAFDEVVGATRILAGGYQSLHYGTTGIGPVDATQHRLVASLACGQGDIYCIAAAHSRVILFPQHDTLTVSLRMEPPPTPSDRRTPIDTEILVATVTRVRQRLDTLLAVGGRFHGCLPPPDSLA